MEFSFINTSSPDQGLKSLGAINDSKNPGEYYNVFLKDQTLYILKKKPAEPMKIGDTTIDTDEPGYNLSQIEFPVKALQWLLDAFELFWKKPSEGGLSSDTLHIDKIVEGDDLRIRFTPNCGGEGVQGFTIKNYSHKGPVVDWQDLQIPYTLLREDGMLDLLKKINIQYQQGSL